MFPAQVSAILERLEQAGFAAYAVGGCVRDTLLGRVPQDWDVATSARPEQTAALFAGRSIPTGLQHGTVTVRQEGLSVEVTTFRADGPYSDHRLSLIHISYRSSRGRGTGACTRPPIGRTRR